MPSFDCPDCGVHMSASDQKALAWGIETHMCVLNKPSVDAWAARADVVEERDLLQMQVIAWLANEYGDPFWWFGAGKNPLMVVRG